jgi:hypothetical protein
VIRISSVDSRTGQFTSPVFAQAGQDERSGVFVAAEGCAFVAFSRGAFDEVVGCSVFVGKACTVDQRIFLAEKTTGGRKAYPVSGQSDKQPYTTRNKHIAQRRISRNRLHKITEIRRRNVVNEEK